MNKKCRFLDSLTARQYGEVVFPLFGTKSGMAQFLPADSYRHGYKFYWAFRVSRLPRMSEAKSGVQVWSEPVNYHGTGFFFWSTCTVSRYKLSRSQKFITVQELNCVLMRALAAVASAKAGVRVHILAGFFLGTGFAKTMTTCPAFFRKSGKQLTHIVRISVSFWLFNPWK